MHLSHSKHVRTGWSIDHDVPVPPPVTRATSPEAEKTSVPWEEAEAAVVVMTRLVCTRAL